MADLLKPALVIGSGFHRHVFGISDKHPKSSYAPLFDWNSLIDNVADELHVARPSRSLDEVMRWEHLILNCVKDGYRLNDQMWVKENARPPHRIEQIARRKVSEILRRLTDNYPLSRRAKIPRLDMWGCVISLNFDYCWHPNNGLKKPRISSFADHFQIDTSIENNDRDRRLQKTVESQRLRAHFPATCEAPRTWFPNGTIAKPRLIRLGLRDYGEAPNSIYKSFQWLKKFEREISSGDESKSDNIFHKIASHLNQGPSESVTHGSIMPWTWVTEFLYRPLVIVGTGLSNQEIGLWWLLNQRARNIAKIENKPKTVILIHQSDRREFWQNRPFGIEPIACEDWEHGWDRLLNSNYDFNFNRSE